MFFGKETSALFDLIIQRQSAQNFVNVGGKILSRKNGPVELGCGETTVIWRIGGRLIKYHANREIGSSNTSTKLAALGTYFQREAPKLLVPGTKSPPTNAEKIH